MEHAIEVSPDVMSGSTVACCVDGQLVIVVVPVAPWLFKRKISCVSVSPYIQIPCECLKPQTYPEVRVLVPNMDPHQGTVGCLGYEGSTLARCDAEAQSCTSCVRSIIAVFVVVT